MAYRVVCPACGAAAVDLSIHKPAFPHAPTCAFHKKQERRAMTEIHPTHARIQEGFWNETEEGGLRFLPAGQSIEFELVGLSMTEHAKFSTLSSHVLRPGRLLFEPLKEWTGWYCMLQAGGEELFLQRAPINLFSGGFGDQYIVFPTINAKSRVELLLSRGPKRRILPP